MTDLRIIDAPSLPTEEITDELKLPTGGKGNYAVEVGGISEHIIASKDLADKNFVNNSSNGVRQLIEDHLDNLDNPHSVTKEQVGLGNVDNTADLDKPVSNATQAAIIAATNDKATVAQLNLKADKTYVDNQLSTKASNSRVDSIETDLEESKALVQYDGKYEFDSAYASEIGGYPLNARITLSNGDIVRNTVAGNTTDPNVDMMGWIPTAASKHNPDYYKLPTDNSDAASFQRLANTNPTKIALTPNKEYDLGTTLITLPVSCVVEGNGAKIKVSGSNTGLTPRPMLRTRLTALSEKGTRVISVTDTTGFNVGDIVHLYIGADTTLNADPYYTAIQYDESDVGYTGQMNVISAIDTVNKTVTLQNSLLYKTSNKGYLQKVYTDWYHFKDLTIEHDGQSSPALFYNYVCNLFTTNVSYTNPNGGVKGVSPNQTFNLVKVIHQSSFNCHHFKPYIGKAVCMHFNHGTVNGSVSFGNIDAHYFSDGGIVMYAGPVNILSYRNNFKFHTLTLNGATATDASAVYFGAKCRDCTSDGDNLDGFFSGYRGYFGSYNASVKNGNTKNSRGSTLQFIGAYDLQILNNNLDRSGFLRYCPRAKVRFNNIDNPNFTAGVSTEPSYALQVIPKIDDLTTAQEGFELIGNTLKGGVSITVGLEDFKIADNTADLLSLYMSQSYCKDGKIFNNKIGGLTLRTPSNIEVFNNDINDTPLRSFTTKRTGGIVSSGAVVIDVHDNRIVSESAGIYNETTNREREVAIRTENNNIIAGTVSRTNRITSTLSPIINVANKDVFAIGTKFYTDDGFGYWELVGWNASNANFEYFTNSKTVRKTHVLGSFPPVANGVFSATPITLTGLSVGDKVDIVPSLTPYTRGYFVGVVTAVDTLQIYFKETSGSSETISSQTLNIYIEKSFSV